jgi:hypothetical protein
LPDTILIHKLQKSRIKAAPDFFVLRASQAG